MFNHILREGNLEIDLLSNLGVVGLEIKETGVIRIKGLWVVGQVPL